eukprot:6655614-Alexandrium_andersonii.AAC.1
MPAPHSSALMRTLRGHHRTSRRQGARDRDRMRAPKCSKLGPRPEVGDRKIGRDPPDRKLMGP